MTQSLKSQLQDLKASQRIEQLESEIANLKRKLSARDDLIDRQAQHIKRLKAEVKEKSSKNKLYKATADKLKSKSIGNTLFTGVACRKLPHHITQEIWGEVNQARSQNNQSQKVT